MILDFFLGFFISFIIYFFFKPFNFHGLNSNEIKKYIYKINNKYFRFETDICICPLIYQMRKN